MSRSSVRMVAMIADSLAGWWLPGGERGECRRYRVPVADEARATAAGERDGGGGGGMFLGEIPGGVSACEGRGQRDLGIFGRDGKEIRIMRR